MAYVTGGIGRVGEVFQRSVVSTSGLGRYLADPIRKGLWSLHCTKFKQRNIVKKEVK